jgi:hypothetical protein
MYLLSVEGISKNGKYIPLGLLSRILYSKDPTVEMGSCFPYPHPLADKIIKHVESVLSALEYTEGPSHVELIVGESGRVEVIDLNPRFVGADVLQSINHALGISVEDILLDACLGREVMPAPPAKQYSCLQYVLPSVGTKRFDAIQFPDDENVRFTTSFLKPGTEVQSTERQLDYLGCYLTTRPTFEEALAYSLKLRAQVVINSNLPAAY